MNPNTLHPAGLIALPILLAIIAGCAQKKPERTGLISPDVSKVGRIDPSHGPQAVADAGLPSIDRNSAANRSTPIVQTGRYSVLAATPSHAQRHPLDVIIDVTIPEECNTIEHAVHFLLRRSGYDLDNNLQADVMELLAKPLPAVHRKLGPLPLKDALILLVTPGFVLQDEPIKRLIRFIPIDENRGGP
jgi:type IV pili sensor histidine kinase/response regulator